MEQKKMSIGTLLNAYPDSIGGKLSDIISLLKKEDKIRRTLPSSC